jgi:AmmeMemoRadiSam system protein A
MLDADSRRTLLSIARAAVSRAAEGAPADRIDLAALPPSLREDGASFVTLTERGALRGCIGSLEARQPLALDVQEHAADAAVRDHRFTPVTPSGVPALHIEVSVLTKPAPLSYTDPPELPRLLRPMTDGVILAKGMRKATFLPQVWEQLPDAGQFLSHLCEKMGADADLWRRERLSVMTYQVECFEEA